MTFFKRLKKLWPVALAFFVTLGAAFLLQPQKSSVSNAEHVIESKDTPLKVTGVSVRIADDGKNGVRFLTKMSLEYYNETGAANIVETGTLLIPETVLGSDELTVDNEDAAKGVTTTSLDVRSDGVYSIVYLYGMPEEVYAEDICARPYVKLGRGETIYGDVAKCSLAYAATSVLENPSYNWMPGQKQTLNSYRPTYTVTFDGKNETSVRWGDSLVDLAPSSSDETKKNVWYDGEEEYDLNVGVTKNLSLTSKQVAADVLPYENTIPFFADDGKTMMISSFQEPRNSSDEEMQQAFQNIKDSGINTVFSWGYQEKLLNYCQTNGLLYLPHIGESNLQSMIDSPISLTKEQRASMKGFYYMDEPTYDEIDDLNLKGLAEMHVVNYPELSFFVNLNPCWTDAEGETDNIYNGHTYEEYVKHYCETVFSVIKTNRILSVDVYPLIKKDNAIKEDWLKSYSIVAKYAKEYDAELHIYFCSTEHYGYRALTLSNLKYMTSVALCYNMDAMGYFTYLSYADQGFGDGLVSPDGLTIYDSYYYAQQVNQDLLKWDEVLRSFDWQDNMCVKGSKWFNHTSDLFDYDSYKVTSMNLLEKVSATRDTIIGRYASKDGRQALMVTNFTDPVNRLEDKVTLTFTDGDYAIVYRDGTRTIETLTNGKLELTLAAGDGAFVIPFKLANYMQAKSGCTVEQDKETYHGNDGISYAFTATSQTIEFAFSSSAPLPTNSQEDVVIRIKAQAGLTATLSCPIASLSTKITFTNDWAEIRISREAYLSSVRHGTSFTLAFEDSSAVGTNLYISPVTFVSAWSGWVDAD